MDSRALVSVFGVLVGCGAPSSPGAEPAPPSASGDPPAEVSETPAVDPPPVLDPGPTGPDDRCEGLVGACGGWIDCVRVRPDPTGPGRFVGVGPNAGHLYDENHDCASGVCNEVCSGGSGNVCRPGLTERIPDMACSEAIPPSHAPFTCWMQDGACVRGPDPRMARGS